jgi:hypothetical protein
MVEYYIVKYICRILLVKLSGPIAGGADGFQAATRAAGRIDIRYCPGVE